MIFQTEINWYKEIMPDLHVVFDVGCRGDNIFYELNPRLEIHLFDPVDRVRHHGIYNKIALGSEPGTKKFYNEYSSFQKRTELEDNPNWKNVKHTFVEVPVSTIDIYCAAGGISKIDLLKIDTEGWDYQVLLGARDMLPNIKYIQFETWTGGSVEMIKQLLKDYDIAELGGKPVNYKCIRK